MGAPIQLNQAPNGVVAKILGSQLRWGAVLYNPSAAATIWIDDSPQLLNQLDATGNPQGGIPLAPGAYLSILPGWGKSGGAEVAGTDDYGDIYLVTTGGVTAIRTLFGANC